ncbi:MAG TPA: hypothetical protein VEC18_01005 [Myxococcota bacterium]|nr:hypothetical protein [Myxococcota bacterium]
MRSLSFALAILSTSGSVGCASIAAIDAKAPEALQAPADLPESARLDVALIEFDPGLPAPGEPIPEDVYPEIRQAEAKLLPVLLKHTLEKSGQWGSVGVLPDEPIASDVIVRATILHSTGRELRLLVEVSDASGRSWFKRIYENEVPAGAYGTSDRRLDPHQPMANTIANAMVEARSELDAKELAEIPTISELQFAAQLSPEVFDGYLRTDERGRVEIVRLPARDEPMLQRVAEVRLRDEMFTDTLGVRYQNFSTQLEPHYWRWREASSSEILAEEALRREQIARGAATALTLAAIGLTGAFFGTPEVIAAAVAGAAIIQYQMQIVSSLGKQREMHQEGLRELAESFQSEVGPMVVELESTAVRLQGTAQAQYQEWQRLLRDVYRAENAMISDVYMLPRQPTEEIWIGDNTLPPVALP